MISPMKNETLFGEPDEFEPTEVKPHTEDKYDLVRYYCDLFSKGMRNKWKGKRVYVDLYSGSGKCRIKGTSKILLGSPLIALSVEAPFDKYIFCESDPISMATLKERVRRLHPKKNVQWVDGDCNEKVLEICNLIPKDNLVLCFVDPFECNIRHETLKVIAKAAHGVDYLCLLAFQMDAKRAMAHYLKPENRKIDDMLGNMQWRDRWQQEQQMGTDFARFLALEFARSMEGLEYRRTELADMKVIKISEKHVPLYYLALFAKHPTAFKFWSQVLKRAPRQHSLF
jgi:three-Cys-motif partner protein